MGIDGRVRKAWLRPKQVPLATVFVKLSRLACGKRVSETSFGAVCTSAWNAANALIRAGVAQPKGPGKVRESGAVK